ncbi:MAG: NAD-dependent epimerase/dehydratase family protein [Alphaproteobacteria bacterium]|nr:MAG: NAD-dependent epimerase/dehydratase family protein [Alphaproteobacteria bacterium]
MKVVITGGTGFIGRMLARRLVARGELTAPSGNLETIDEIVLFDAVAPAHSIDGLDDRVRIVTGDIADCDLVRSLIDRDDVSVFHLASVVSGGGERDFDLALKVNLTGALNVFGACRARSGRPRVVFASSLAVFGGAAMPRVVGDTTKQTPQTTYGATKAIGELLINDYTRKGFFDGRAARLPTIIIRPGRPNLAASSFASGVFREPLAGRTCLLPVSLSTRMPVLGYRTAVEGFIALHEADGAALGDDRAVNFPSLSVTVEEMIAALRRVAGNRPLGDITPAPDPAIEAIVATWPVETEWTRAAALGLPVDADVDGIVRAYIEDFVDEQD